MLVAAVAALTLTLAPPAYAQAPPVAVSHRSLEASLLMLEVVLDGHVLSDSLSAYPEGRHVLLPLGELARLLTLAITVHPERASAGGYVLREDRGFALNVAESVVTVGGREQHFESRLAAVIGDDIYVSSRLLTMWLPIDLELELSKLQLRVKPRVKLPLQQRLARESAAERLGTGSQGGRADPGYPHARAPVRMLSAPMIDQTVSSQARLIRGKSHIESRYTAYATADVLGMEGAAYISRPPQKNASDLRVTLGRHDPDGGLLGPLQARSIVVGSIAMPAVPNVMLGSSSGVGLAVSNRRLDQSTQFGRHTLRGDLPPGWDVTLYYNDALTGYQQSRADGQYAFEDLPLNLGTNEFRLVFNGPLGQVRVERQRFLLDQSVLKPGQLVYALAQQRSDKGVLRRVAEFDLGLTRAIAANAAFVSKPGGPKGLAQTYSLLGLRGYWDAMILGSQVSIAPGGARLYDHALKTRLGRYALDFQHLRRQRGYESDQFASGPGGVRVSDRLRANGSLRLAGWAPVSLTIEALREAAESGTKTLGLSGGASTLLAGTSVTNGLRWQKVGGIALVDGSLQFSRRVVDIGLNAQIEYSLRPQAALQSLSLSGDRHLGEGYRVNAGLTRAMASNLTTVSVGLSKDFRGFGLALNGSYSSQRELTLGFQLFFALGSDPRGGATILDAQPLAGSGAVSARAFLDRNRNGVYDDGEDLLPNVGYILNGGGRHPRRSDDSGNTFIGRLQPGQYTDIALDPGTLEDPQWQPLTPGARVLPRPGFVQMVDFPVVATSEVDGVVYLVEQGKRRPIGDARIELVDASGKLLASTRSSADGYYLLNQIVPGRHVLRIAPDQVARLKLSGTLERPIEASDEGGMIGDQDFELHRTGR